MYKLAMQLHIVAGCDSLAIKNSGMTNSNKMKREREKKNWDAGYGLQCFD